MRVLAPLLLVMVVLVVASPAAGQTANCEARVADTSGTLTPEGSSELAGFVDLLASAGTTPHVRLLDDTDAGIDQWFAEQERACPSWAPGGIRQPDLLVLAVSIGDRRTGTWYGEDLAAVLDATYLDVHDDMTPDLRAGDYQSALELGVLSYAALLDVRPPAPTDGVDGVDTSQPLPIPQAGAGEPQASVADPIPAGTPADGAPPAAQDDGGPGWPAAVGVLALAGLGAGGTLGVRRQRAVTAARGSYLQTKADVRSAYVDLDAAWGALADEALVTVGGLDPADRIAIAIETERQQAAGAVAAVTASYVATAEKPDERGWDPASYRRADGAWSELAQQVADARREVDEVAQAVTALRTSLERADTLREGFDGRRLAAADAIATAAADGFHTTRFTEAVEAADAALDASERAADGRRFGEAADAIDRATSILEEVRVAAEGVRQRQLDLTARHSALEGRASDAPAAVDAVTSTVTGLRQRFAEAVVEPVADNPTLAAEALGEAMRLLADGAHHLSMAEQRFDEADVALASAAAALDAVDAVARGTATVAQDVEAAQQGWAAAEAEASRSLAAARDFANAHATDVSSEHLPALDRAVGVLEQARTIASGPRPDPLVALHRLREVDRAADAILATARGEKETRDRQRSAARDKIADASAEVGRAESKSGFGLFGWSKDAREQLEGARRQIAQARGLVATTPVRAESLAGQAERTARAILDEARRRTQNTAAAGGIGAGSVFGSGSSFGGGGSSSFGGGGGGSSSFGGGGGGSSSW